MEWPGARGEGLDGYDGGDDQSMELRFVERVGWRDGHLILGGELSGAVYRASAREHDAIVPEM